MRHILLLMLVLLLTGCEMKDDTQSQIAFTAKTWAEAYFNGDFRQALQYTTAEDGKWLRFAASNINEQDLKLLNGRPEAAKVVVTGVYVGNDTMATAGVDVSNWLSMDSIDGHGRIHEQGEFMLELVKRDSQWLVKMAGLPRSERQSRD